MITLNSKHIYINGYYFFSLRQDLISFYIYRLSYPLFILYLYNSCILSFAYFLFGWFAFISIYEIFYIDNDFYAVQKEDKPSLRLKDTQSIIDIKKFIYIRIAYFIISLIILYAISNIDIVLKFFVAGCAVGLVFFVHNRLPRRRRLISYSFLKISHLTVPIIFILNNSIILAILIFYLPSTILTYMKKIFSIESVTIAQLYLLILQFIIIIAMIVFYYYNNVNYLKDFFILSIYLFTARITEIIIRRKIK